MILFQKRLAGRFLKTRLANYTMLAKLPFTQLFPQCASEKNSCRSIKPIEADTSGGHRSYIPGQLHTHFFLNNKSSDNKTPTVANNKQYGNGTIKDEDDDDDDDTDIYIDLHIFTYIY